MDEERRLPPFAEDTLALVADAAGGSGKDLLRDEAIDVIADDERFDKVDAEEALEILDNRGYIYTVGEAIRVTPTARRVNSSGE
ncbi:hypothetical protein [Halococcus qingdaonensis]|uniref:hypothetical protein n=1 Tax=Halococcus qingdaonensis TaxID=224402 RepID=UPI00211632E0|nr:hypothetical protein [Halococcus qingdaonensis]